MKKQFAIVAALAAGAFAMSSAQAGGVNLSIGVGVPYVGVPAPVYVAPRAYYAPPPPVVYAPPPVHYAPAYAPAYGYAPAPVYYGYDPHRGGRWERERWERARWEREHRGWGR